MAVEGTFRSIDPLMYHVNVVSDLDKDIVSAHLNNDTAAIKRMTKQGDTSFDIFICINDSCHAFILCVPAYQKQGDPLGISSDMPNDDPWPLAVPDSLLTWVFELCFEREELRLYKIRKDFCLFGDAKKSQKVLLYRKVRKGQSSCSSICRTSCCSPTLQRPSA